MLAAKFLGRRDARIDDYPVPKIEDNELLVRVATCGICGTDIHIYEGEVPLATLPVIPGHEFCGRIEEVGTAVTDLALGDAVVVEPNLFCGQCHYCRTGKKHFCVNWAGVGVTRDGGFAEFAAVPRQAVYAMPEWLSFKKGSFFEPVACVLHGIERAGLLPGDSVVLCGAGSIGLLFVQLLKRAGAGQVIVSDFDPVKLDVARDLGADIAVNPAEADLKEVVMERTAGFGAEIAIDATGSPEAISSLFELAQQTGKILLFGVSAETAQIKVRPFDIYRRELTIVSSFTNPYTNEASLSLLGDIEVDKIVTHRIGLENLLRDGIDAIREKRTGVIKVQVVLDEQD
jgi:2-desacetyl-2-hydroxyethyl bacteriochlorophyllide A dehydrogenase